MAASLNGVFPATLQEKIQNSKILVVGAGGIGCEILKNLVLSGFPDIEIIDLDTIDVSNLNRQFLFNRDHVGKPKSQVARDSAMRFNPHVKIKAYHDSIMATTYGVHFFKKFDCVLNALDNCAARNHVNRMCLNTDVALIESGTAGYNGQVELIKKGLTQCYECTPKSPQKSFPGCSIRNTPSEPIHCIVWAKHLFNQLFAETADDEDISPDVADIEVQEEYPANIVRVNTRQWAKDSNYDAATLFNKFFYEDINYLLSMSNLWKTRKAPTPIQWDTLQLSQRVAGSDAISQDYKRQHHNVWSLAECAAVFADCLKILAANLKKLNGDSLVWNKDHQPEMDFVAACANIRAYIFEIARKSRFEIKSMAGNIIPAIATTNAITAGVAVLQTFKVMQADFEKCKSVYMRLRQNPHQQLIVPEKILTAPKSNCYVCAPEPTIHLQIDTHRMRIKEFRDEVLIKTLHMVNPDVIVDTKEVLVISSKVGETECNENELISDMDIEDGVLLKSYDFFQNYELGIIIKHINTERDEPIFEVVMNKEQLKPRKEPVKDENNRENDTAASDDADGPSTSKKKRTIKITDDEDDDLCLIEDDLETDVDVAKLVTHPKNKNKNKMKTKYVNCCSFIEKYPSDIFHSHFQMTRSTFKKLCIALQPFWPVHVCARREFPLDQSLYITLWKLSNNISFRQVGYRFDINVSTATGIFFKTIKVICCLKAEIAWPSVHQQKQIMAHFQSSGHSDFPYVVGCVYATHFVNYSPWKEHCCTITQAICDIKFRFLDVFIGYPGNHDVENVWRNSPVCKGIYSGQVKLAPNAIILGDSSYPLSNFMMVPYRNNGHLSSDKKKFNYCLSSTRAFIEQTFGILKKKFKILERIVIGDKSNEIPNVILACIILHNFIINQGEVVEYVDILTNVDESNVDSHNASMSTPEIDEDVDGIIIRNNLTIFIA